MRRWWRARRAAYRAWRDRLRGHRVAEPTWQLLVFVTGIAVLGLGIVLLPLPGPGWIVIFLGLGILAAEFAWAQRLLARCRGYYQQLRARARQRRAASAQRRPVESASDPGD